MTNPTARNPVRGASWLAPATSDPSRRRWSWERRGAWWTCATATAGTIAYLSGNALAAAWFLAFSLGLLLPAVALVARGPVVSGLPAAERSILSALVVFLATPVWFYARRLSPWPPAADLAAVFALWGGARRCGAFAHWCDDFRAAMKDLCPILPFFAIPLVFAGTWAGFAVDRPDGVAFHGLFPLDFCNLANCVSLIGMSGFPPVNGVVDSGVMHYHWLYFTIPTLLTGIAGDSMRVSSALVLCNAITAVVLMLAIAHVARESAGEGRHRLTVTATVAAVMFAPLASYAFQFISQFLHAPWTTPGGRNTNLLTIVNSMAVFGNNTTALVMVVCIVRLLARWNESGTLGRGILFCLLLSLLPGYSSTLVAPIVLSLGCWFLLGRVRDPLRAIVIALPVAATAWLLLHALNVLGGTQRLEVGFDGGRFLMTFGLASMPLWVTALLGDRNAVRLEPWSLIVAAGFAVPSLLKTTGSGTTPSDLSMKTASLMVLAMTPAFARGVDGLLRGSAIRSRRGAMAGTLLLLGLANTAAYAGQFVACRILGIDRKVQILPRGYDALLDRVRTTTDRSAVVLDAVGIDMPWTLWPLSRAERRVVLPNEFTTKAFLSAMPDVAGPIAERVEEFLRWRGDGYAPGDGSDAFADMADCLVLPAGFEPGPSWAFVEEVEGYQLYRSTRRSTPRPEIGQSLSRPDSKR